MEGIFDYLIAANEDQETKEAALPYHFIPKAEIAADALKTLDRFMRQNHLSGTIGGTSVMRRAPRLKVT